MQVLTLLLITHFAGHALGTGCESATAQGPAHAPTQAQAADKPASKPAAREHALSPLLLEGTLQDALNKANAERRVLVVVQAKGPGRLEAITKLWTVPAMAAWAKRHAIVYGVTEESDLRTIANIDATSSPEPICFLDSKQLRLFGSGIPQRATRLANPKTEPSLGTLLKLDWTLMKKAEGDAGLAAARGEPAKPEFDAEGKEVVARIAAIAGLTAEETAAMGSVDAAAWLREVLTNRAGLSSTDAKVKAEAETKHLRLYIAAMNDEALLGARVTVLAPELAAAAKASPVLREQLGKLRQAMLLGPWYRDGRLALEALALSRVTGEEELLRFVDDSLNDVDAIVIMPLVERAKYEMLLRQVGWGGPVNTHEATTWVNAAVRRLGEGKPTRMSDEQWAMLAPLRRSVSALQASRAVALLGSAGAVEAGVPGVTVPEAGADADAKAAAAAAEATREVSRRQAFIESVKRLIQADEAIAKSAACAALAAGQGERAAMLLTGEGAWKVGLGKLAEEMGR